MQAVSHREAELVADPEAGDDWIEWEHDVRCKHVALLSADPGSIPQIFYTATWNDCDGSQRQVRVAVESTEKSLKRDTKPKVRQKG